MADEKPKRPRALPKPRKSVWDSMSKADKEKAIANLRAHQFKPGQSGHDRSISRGSFNLDRALRNRLEDPQIRAKLVEVLLDRAFAGDPAAIKLVVERTGGAIMPNVLLTEQQQQGAESSTRTVLFSDEEDAQKLQPAGQAENDEDEE